MVHQTGPMNWNSKTRLDENAWKNIFTSQKSICKETKLKEFQFKLIHRIVVTKKELHRYGIKTDDECLYCGEKDSIDHTFLNCRFVKIFVNNVLPGLTQLTTRNLLQQLKKNFLVLHQAHTKKEY